MKNIFLLVSILYTILLSAQTDSISPNKPSINLGLMFFAYDHKIESSVKYLIKGYDSNIGLVPRGLRFTSELKLAKEISLRLEPGVVIERPIYVQGMAFTSKATDIQVPLLFKLNPFKQILFKPYLIGGYVANYRFSRGLSGRNRGGNDAIEYGIGVDYKLSKSSLGIGVRMNVPIYSDIFRSTSPESFFDELKVSMLMICLTLDNK